MRKRIQKQNYLKKTEIIRTAERGKDKANMPKQHSAGDDQEARRAIIADK